MVEIRCVYKFYLTEKEIYYFRFLSLKLSASDLSLKLKAKFYLLLKKKIKTFFSFKDSNNNFWFNK